MNRILLPLICLITIPIASISIVYSQTTELKEAALQAFEAEDYSTAISLLERVIKQDSKDAEAFYLLGYYTHYLAHDSIPLIGYSLDHSDKVLEYLRKAVSLDPNLGNAYYFIGAEYGARFDEALIRGDISGMRTALVEGRQEGGYPDWMIEFGRNTLGSCEPNAILFTGGDLDANSAWYLQLVEEFRKDVTVIPLWYLVLLCHKTPGREPLAPQAGQQGNA